MKRITVPTRGKAARQPGQRRRSGAVTLALALVALPAIAGAQDAARTAKRFEQCTVCHGVGLGGNVATEAPAIAGLPEWYLLAQLGAYRSGLRGTHGDDGAGHAMRAVAMALSEDDVAAAAAWVAAMSPAQTAPRLEGDASHGQMLYRSCAGCHGKRGGGNEALSAPPLAGQHDWYLARQLRHFRTGVRGSDPDDPWGKVMQSSVRMLAGDQDIVDVSVYLASLGPAGDETGTTSAQEDDDMTRRATGRLAAPAAALSIAMAAGTGMATAEEITRYPLPNNSTFPIARAVETPAGTTLVHHSGMTPRPAHPDAERGTRWYWGDTKTQAMSVFERLGASLEDMGLGYGDIIKMTVFLVGDDELGGRMDFSGFMEAYTQFFGTEEQPNLPARSAVQVAGLAAEGMMVEIEVILARPSAPQAAAADSE